jgi:hypothetical protein
MMEAISKYIRDGVQGMTQRLFKILFRACSFFLILYSSHGEAIEEDEIRANQIAIVLASAPEPLSVPTIDFYQAVFKALQLQGASYWQPLAPAVVKENLQQEMRLNSLGEIPAFDRKYLDQALQVKGDKESEKEETQTSTDKKVARGKETLIAPIHYMLDTLAVGAAIVVSCDPKGQEMVASCSLHYYSRSQAKVIATVQKRFLTGIKDPTRWAAPMIDNLYNGIKNKKYEKDRSKLHHVLGDQEDRNSEAQDQIEVTVFGRSLKGAPLGLHAAPGASFMVGRLGRSYGYGAELAYAATERRSTSSDAMYREWGASALFGAQARALEALLWDLQLAIGYHHRLLKSDEKAAGSLSSELVSQQIMLRAGVGMLWQFSDNLFCGMIINNLHYFQMEDKASGMLADDHLGSNGMGVGLRMRTIF